jgi:hypothetical protein
MLIAAFSLPASAQTMVSKEQANTYFASCVENSAKTETRFSPQSQKMFCACTAARLTQFFTVEDMQTMTSPTDPNARIALNKMIVNIYAPCMEEPTREYHYSSCISNPQVSALGGDPQRLCQCAADQIATHLATNGAQMFQDILNRNPTIVDPMQALYDDPKFQSFAQSKLMGCLR